MNDPSTANLLTCQSAMNRSTSGQWQLYANHRNHIERLIVPKEPGEKICVLGAGNCNDLDLPWMTRVYDQVHLVDIDEASLKQAVRRQKCEPSRRLVLHAPVDLTCAATIVEAWKTAAPDDAAVEECLRRIRSSAARVSDAINARAAFNLVLSPCVLSQLMIFVRDAISSTDPRYPRLRAAIRAAHLQLMLELLKPAGSGVLLLDAVSSEHFSGLPQVAEDRADDVMRSLIARGKCFEAITPAAMRRAIADDEVIKGALDEPLFTPAWLWHLGLNKTFAVYALQFVRKSNPPNRRLT